MIRIPLLGRTGNNLFQYAIGRVLSEETGAELVLDGTWFDRSGWRQVSRFLDLPIRAHVRRHPSLASRVVRKATHRHYWEFGSYPILREKTADHTFDAAFLEAPADCMLFGYFQSPLYFERIAPDLRAELNALIGSATAVDLSVRKKLEAPDAVSVHVRRSDYLTNPVLRVCGPDYYRDAFHTLREKLAQPRFFIFSDDPKWCAASFNMPDCEVIHDEARASDPLHDLRLLSLTSHHVIANSSYSWWAAWLGFKEGQEVIMPDRWFADDIVAPVSEKKLEHWTIIPTNGF